jgi:hypothetical protein
MWALGLQLGWHDRAADLRRREVAGGWASQSRAGHHGKCLGAYRGGGVGTCPVQPEGS